MSTLKNCFFGENIVLWYKKNNRDLPWRHTNDPYLIWLSEIILQQTRVAQGLPYYLRFVEAFPDIKAFAEANEDEVLRLWQGLGYYSRARNMLITARVINEKLDNVFPASYKELLKLKGIGTYTAAAIASFAYNEHIAVLDGNVFRVLARFFGIHEDILSNQGKLIFTKKANEVLPKNDSALHNQAIMEFGALQCTPFPNCERCPINLECFAFQNKLQNQLPVKIKKLTIKQRFLYYIILEKNQKFYFKKREGNEIWQGLFEFYLKEYTDMHPVEAIIDELTQEHDFSKFIIASCSNEYKHKLTHQNLSIWFIHLKLNEEDLFYNANKSNFYSKKEIENLPKPIVIANYFEKNLCNYINGI